MAATGKASSQIPIRTTASAASVRSDSRASGFRDSEETDRRG